MKDISVLPRVVESYLEIIYGAYEICTCLHTLIMNRQVQNKYTYETKLYTDNILLVNRLENY